MKNLEKYAPELYCALVRLLFCFSSVLIDNTNDKTVKEVIKAANEANQLLARIENEQAD